MEHRTRRTLRHVVTTVAMLISVAWSASASAATEECFLRVDGVLGDSADARHRGEIELLSWTLGMTSPHSSVGGQAPHSSCLPHPSPIGPQY